MREFCIIAVLLVAGAIPCAARAEDYVLTLKDHKFEPQELVIPAGQKVKILIKNLDATPAEFESFDLNREKVVNGGGGQATIFVGPLEPGSYAFFDDFNQSTATGTLKVK